MPDVYTIIGVTCVSCPARAPLVVRCAIVDDGDANVTIGGVKTRVKLDTVDFVTKLIAMRWVMPGPRCYECACVFPPSMN